jgi:hypothetical protein
MRGRTILIHDVELRIQPIAIEGQHLSWTLAIFRLAGVESNVIEHGIRR